MNRRLIRGVEDIEGLTFCDLYEEYPQLDIDIQREQQLLEAHDVIVLQHPFYWYSTPAMFKEWQDLVLQHGWAYGRGGNALHGKIVLNALTAGGGEEAYCAEGSNRFSIRQLLAPLEQTARLCGMRYLAPFVVHGTHSLTPEQIELHRESYHRLLTALVENQLDLDAAQKAARINRDLDSLITTATS